MNTQPKTKTTWKHILILQSVIIIYSMSTVATRFASAALNGIESIFDWNFLLRVALVIFILACYALIWQQVLKRFDLSIAYCNKATHLLWSLLWAMLFFNESITIPKVIGIVIVFVGIMIMNFEVVEQKEESETP